ncbi:MAG: restriction endonuclease subunit S [Verrucomicrobia bacterium]|jgi:type I restriction enzyme S subunit|nr:restriction endonuclease subunit S [Verrucomicrobiota bacterium]
MSGLLPLGEVCRNASRAFDLKKPEAIFINTGDVLNGDFLHSDYSETRSMPGQAKKAILKDDILYSEIRPGNGRFAYVNFDAPDHVVSTKFMVIEAFDRILPKYLYLILTSASVQNEFKLIAESRSGTFPQITFDAIAHVPIPVPEIEEQERIIDSYFGIHDKIALNRKLNETLEEMARALFQSWFVDFDPVKAKLAAVRNGSDPERACMAALSGKLRIAPGKPKSDTLAAQLPTAEELDTAIAALDTLSPAQLEKLAQTAAHFPADFEDSELGLVPEGWKASEIGNEVSIYGGATPSTKEEKFWDGDYAWATPKDLSGIPSKVLISTQRRITDQGVAKISSGQLPAGSVLMSSRAPVGYLALATAPISINQGFIAMVCDKKLPNSYVLLWAEAVMDEIKSKASGSTFAEISKKAFRPIQLVVPNKSILTSFDQIVTGFYRDITLDERQTRTLAELRDTLLPKLLSGELSVGEIQSAAEIAENR